MKFFCKCWATTVSNSVFFLFLFLCYSTFVILYVTFLLGSNRTKEITVYFVKLSIDVLRRCVGVVGDVKCQSFSLNSFFIILLCDYYRKQLKGLILLKKRILPVGWTCSALQKCVSAFLWSRLLGSYHWNSFKNRSKF